MLVGREKTIRLYGPKGFIEHVQHKLLGYRWNLVDRYVSDLIFVVTEIDSALETQTARFRLKNAFAAEAVGGGRSTPANRAAIIRLAQNADLLFIEAAFAQADTALAAERAHLTTAAAGSLARAARVRRVEPFHFSPRYSGQEARMLDEVMTAFAGRDAEGAAPSA